MMMVVGVIRVVVTVMVVAIVMMMIVTIVMMVVTMAVPSCGWSRAGDCDCANYAQCCSDLP